MASVTFSTGLGGDGSTVTDDTNPTTGLAGYGYTVRLVPAFGQILNLANFAKAKVTEANAAAALAKTWSDSALNAPGTNGASVTEYLIGTGSKIFTLDAVKDYAVGQAVIAASRADPSNYMAGQITAHDRPNRLLTINVTQVGGGGTKKDWVISMAALVNSQLPGQNLQEGKFLTTNGTQTDWARALRPENNLSDLQDKAAARTQLNVQLASTTLTAFSSVSLATADRLPYVGSGSAVALTPFTTQARTLLAAGSQAAQQTALGLTPGVHVQSYSTRLQSISDLMLSGDKLLIGTSGSAVGTLTLSTSGRGVIESATPQAARQAITAAVAGSNNDITALTALSTPITVSQGGTGGTSKVTAKAALGISFGTAAPTGGDDGDVYFRYA